MKVIKWTGKQISAPGIYAGIPLDVYHSAAICDGPSVSSSGLRRLFAKSPAHFYSEWPENPYCVESPDKPIFIIGRAAHHLFLSEKGFGKSFCVEPPTYPDRKTGEMKPWSNNSAFAKDFHASAQSRGLAVLTQSMVKQIRGMAQALSRHPIVRAGALNGLIEHSIFWKDKKTSLWLKARPDAIPQTDVDFCDLKITYSVLWNDLQRTIAECGYHAQGALIRTAARDLLGIKSATFTLIFIERNPPHCVRIVTLKDNDLDRGERQNRAALDTIATCLRSKTWPGPGGDREDAEHIELPAWAQKQIDDRLEFGI